MERDIPGCKEAMKYVDDTISNIPDNRPHKAVARLEPCKRSIAQVEYVGTNKYKPEIIKI